MRVTLCRDSGEFQALGPQWTALQRRCRTATPFQSHAWLHSWWRSYGTDGWLRVILVRRGDVLVGAAPLMLAHRPLPVLVPLGGEISDFFDVLLDDDCAEEAAAALVRGLDRLARTRVVDLREVRPGGAAERVHRLWPGPRRRMDDSVCLELPVAPLPELMERLPSRNARRFRAKLRKIESLGIEERAVPAREVPHAVENLLRLHGMQWRGRGVTPEHLRPRFAEHLVRATRQMVRDGDAVLTEYRMDGRVVAADVTLMSADLAGGYLYGADPELRARKVDITTMLLRHDARQATESGRRVLSLLRGTEPYKQHWRPETVTNQRLLLAGRGAAPLLGLYVAAVEGRRRAGEALHRQLPALRRLRARLNSLRADGAGR
ncbi:GNAT family N-acetyltransferase [Streptomyces durbertensis]|uniref:GNAT family N-acetyltransferase n=1 Tax=Streptomyces durbertensis TaxID=2448886 RepID=A0ABR6ENX2_9ACTN|nr:GNAT family N-acetyltransferase [Streptomyces durbertensis]MBB1247045.1 GNAT family N-acetyltransferase [Streptomyces durbertensis]